MPKIDRDTIKILSLEANDLLRRPDIVGDRYTQNLLKQALRFVIGQHHRSQRFSFEAGVLYDWYSCKVLLVLCDTLDTYRSELPPDASDRIMTLREITRPIVTE